MKPLLLRFWRFWLLHLLGLVLAGPLAAQAPEATDPVAIARQAVSQYKVDRWQAEQGLPMNTVQALLQTRDGTLWVGTGSGLVRFDGRHFAAIDTAALADLAARPVFGLMEDRQGVLWVGHGRGAARWVQGRFEPAFDHELTAGRRVWAFAQGADGAVWAATENGLLRWQAGQARLYQEADGLPTRRLRTLAFDRDGTLWIGTTGGGLVALRDGRFETLDASAGLPHAEVRQVLADPAGGLWVATAGGGLVHVGHGAMRYYRVADGLPSDHLTALAYDANDNLWVGTWGGGLSRYSQGRFSTLDAGQGLTDSEHVWSLHRDHEGSLWMGSWHGGLSRIGKRAFVAFGKPEGLLGENVRAVLHARDGSTWVATAGGGLNRIEGGRLQVIGRREGLLTREISTLFEDGDGTVWIGSYTDGLARWRNGRVDHFGMAEGLPHHDVRALLRDRQGVLWVGTMAGLARWQGPGFAAVREPGAPTEGVLAAVEDRRGSLWFGTSGAGLLRWHEGAFSSLRREQGLSSNWIVALHEDSAGSLWIGTNGEGLNRLRDGRIAVIGTAQGLADGLVQVILEDRAGQFWTTSNRGFSRVARAELDAVADGRATRVHAVSYGPGDALRSSTFAGGLQGAGAIDARGQLWLPSYKGLVIVDPQRLPDRGEPPPVRVDEVRIDGVARAAGTPLTLPPGGATLTLHFAAASLAHAERVRFRYRVHGLTTDWVDAGAQREVTLAALPPGDYRFELAATLDGQRWREAAQPLQLHVQPRLLQKPWVLALLALALAGAVLGAYRLRTHQLRRRHAEMERLVAERTEALRQANEHLSRLSFQDALTGLPNRRRLDLVLDSEWRRAMRLRTPMAVVMADIDAFKAYNDSLGHPAADRCLVEVAEVLRETANRACDFAARYGGEEFIILIAGADLAAALEFAERLRTACEARAIPHPGSPVAAVLTLSLGVASQVPPLGSSALALVTAADAALYRAKQGGRNRVASGAVTPGAPGASAPVAPQAEPMSR